MDRIVCGIPLSKALNGFLGVKEIPDKVILTPISAIYDEIKTRYDAKDNHSKWWDNFVYSAKGNQKIIVIGTHQGNTIVDTVLVTNHCKGYVTFLGYCGGIGLKYGDLTIPTRSRFEYEDETYKPKLDPMEVKHLFPSFILGPNLTTASVLREEEAIEKPGYLRDEISTDQETAYLFKESESKLLSTMVIADLPLMKSVFEEPSEQEKKQVKNGTKKMIDTVIKFMDLTQ